MPDYSPHAGFIQLCVGTGTDTVIIMLASLLSVVLSPAAVDLGDGIKIGEVTDRSAILWTRLTQDAEPRWRGQTWLRPAKRTGTPAPPPDGSEQLPVGARLEDMAGALPGCPGGVRWSWWPKAHPEQRRSSEWLDVAADRDFTRQLAIAGLQSGSEYQVEVATRDVAGVSGAALQGRFRTAPAAEADASIRFVVTTCQSYKTRDDGERGMLIYPAMLRLNPDFFIHTGDVVYYDVPSQGADIAAKSPALARFLWNRWYGCANQRDFHAQVASYFMKDDHDLVCDDCRPGANYGNLTWQDGLAIFREQVPLEGLSYRTIRWGRQAQLWLLETREFRSGSTPEDLSILGQEQLAWLRASVAASDARYRILVSPDPVVGPDRSGKADNHANVAYRVEGEVLRRFCAENGVIVICGDRHWQYHSIDPATGTEEFGCGPGSDAHSGGFTVEQRTPAQRFLRIKGGFLSVVAEGGVELTIQHHDVAGAVVYERKFAAPPRAGPPAP